MRTSYLSGRFAVSFILTFANDGGATVAERFNNASLKGNYAVFNIGRGGQTRAAGTWQLIRSWCGCDGDGDLSAANFLCQRRGRSDEVLVLIKAETEKK